MNPKLYYFDIEVKAGDNCKLSPNVKGAVVNCYTYEKSLKLARKKVLEALSEDNYII